MSRYEADPAGLGVGKRYGPLGLGGIAGVTCATSGEGRFVFEVSAAELESVSAIALEIPDGYALITKVIAEVETAFGTGDTLAIEKDGVSITTAPIDVATLGIAEAAMTAPVSLDAGEVLTVDAALVDSGDLDGYAKIIVEFTRV
jgi:hypothetical protein